MKMPSKNNLGFLLVVLVIALVGGAIIANVRGTSSFEGFQGLSSYDVQGAPFNVNQQVNTKNWGTPNMVVTPGAPSWGAPTLAVVPGQPVSQAVTDFLSRDPQPVPLPEGELLMFANTPFKPQCCPSAYSNSQGCACMTADQYNYLIQRGSNNVPFSEY